MKQTGKYMLAVMRRFSLICCMAVCYGLSASAQSIDLKLKDVTVQTAVLELQKQHGYSVAVKSNELDMSKVISVDLRNRSVEDVIRAIFDGQNVDITVSEKNIIVAKGRPSEPVKVIRVKGVVKDDMESLSSELPFSRKAITATQ